MPPSFKPQPQQQSGRKHFHFLTTIQLPVSLHTEVQATTSGDQAPKPLWDFLTNCGKVESPGGQSVIRSQFRQQATLQANYFVVMSEWGQTMCK